MPALETYRASFKPSAQLDRPYAMAGVNVFAAETDADARRLFTSVQQQITNRLRGTPGRFAAADRRHRALLDTAGEGRGLGEVGCSFVGSQETVRDGPGGIRHDARAWTK
jgi:alkanesulfonate monooxygenase SsuD/methylene tetrahydromethanopterin reductase-like flavin-dependent oxidoreductase (luciferase family)